MKIAIVLMKYNPFGGYERQAAILAEWLSERGHEVTVFANEWKGDSAKKIRFQKVPVIKLTSWLKVLSFAVFSKRRLDKERFDVTLAFDRTLKMDIYRAGNACHKEWMAFRRKNFGTSDAFSMAINPLHRVINGIEERIFSGIQKNNGNIVALSRIGKDQIRRHYNVDDGRFIVIPPVVDFKRFDTESIPKWRKEVRDALFASDDALFLLHVGSGFRIKGLKSTIESLPYLLKKGIKVKLLVAGSDRRGTKNLQRLSAALGVEKSVLFLGGVKDIERFYAASDIFVVPSLFETFGVAAIEALSLGLPVIIGRGAGVSYMIEEEEAGKVIDVPADPGKLADMIAGTAEEEASLKKSGKLKEARAKRRAVASRCSAAAVMPRYVALIESTGRK